jgi:hypothetical protein
MIPEICGGLSNAKVTEWLRVLGLRRRVDICTNHASKSVLLEKGFDLRRRTQIDRDE